MARVESKTVISTPERLESVPPTADGVAGRLGHWMAPNQLDAKVQELFPGCMRGRFGFLEDTEPIESNYFRVQPGNPFGLPAPFPLGRAKTFGGFGLNVF